MPLTPADVRNKQFSTTRLRPGYDEEEVDAFLDEVESELDRLIQENEELRGKLAECLRGKVPNAGMQDFQQPQDQAPEPQQHEQMRPEPVQQPQAVEPQPPVQQQMPMTGANMGMGGEENMDTAARVLALAQQTADQAISDARREADETLGRARHESEDILGKARRQADQIIGEARARSENLDRDAQERHRQVMGSLVQQREELEHKVNVLKDFEREYRSRLKDYFERQLRELNEEGKPVEPNPNTTGGFQTMAPQAGGAPALQHGPGGNPFGQPEPAQHGGFHPGEAPHERR
ncbi:MULTISPECIES: DivIVA domain-containing protein [Nocardiopsidaceae]|jgi:DivIVA domain-containing protein|uniref:Cell wall synthesis protein Wag31 n=2 Tax=Nocardiopsidaceae TaxID=83676 RepID=A0ABY6YII3_9ACTN|nr:DivIVA domain-containing protein [Streptomonospora nanhaiensis]MEE2044609.1 DivIVA domain-containing protein [Nocardiopsis tropica]WAE72009.1 DivIVA domain-containing protein [Streptomonospora nanhaiensis]